MNMRKILSNYTYLLSAILLISGFMGALEFALYSAIEHILWFRMMHHNQMAPDWLWFIVLVLISTLTLFWYRLLKAIVWTIRSTVVLNQKLTPQLQPLSMTLPPSLENIATWYSIDNNDHFAFTWGWQRPRVAISKGLFQALDPDAKRALLYHEAAHVQSHDFAQELVFEVLSKALPFLGIELLYRRFQIRREIAADASSIAACGGNDLPLLSALLTTLRPSQAEPPCVGFEGTIDARIAFLQTGHIPTLWDSQIRSRLLTVLCFISALFGQGLLIWCH